MRRPKIPTLIALVVLIVGIVAGVLLTQQNQFFRLGADVKTTPKNVRITNIADDSFTVSWTTDDLSPGFIKWGESQNALSNTDFDELADKGYTHYITLRGLQATTTYFFSIISDGYEYDNNGSQWTATTGVSLAPPSSKIISGTILNGDGTPAEKAIVYVSVAGASQLSTITSKSGAWVIPISLSRTSDLATYTTLNANTDILEIAVQATTGVASAQSYIRSSNPTPPIMIGGFYDFKNTTISKPGDIPVADLQIPDSSQSSKFLITEGDREPDKEVTLDSINQDETITSTKPEFFGKAPPAIELTITLESDPVTDTVTTASDGNWTWNPPDNLEPGTHKITVTWRDVSGVLNSITRTFVVLAADGPGFEATPSATPTTTPTATPKTTPSATPTSSAKPKITATPVSTATSSATPFPIPDSGSLTPTILMLIMGLGLLILGGLAGSFMYKKE